MTIISCSARAGLMALVLLSSACAGPAPFVIQDAAPLAAAGSEFGQDATVYVFRDGASAYGMLAPGVLFVDGQRKGGLSRENYVVFPVSANHHELRMKWMIGSVIPQIAISFNAEAAKTYFFVISVDGGINHFSSTFSQIGAAAAEPRKAEYYKLETH